MFDVKTDTIFETSNKIRSAWVNALTGTLTEVKLKSHPRELRFELYAEIDNDIRAEYTRLMAEYNTQMRLEDNYSTRAILGRRILKKEHQVDCDDFLYQAITTVVSQVEAELDYHREPELQIAA